MIREGAGFLVVVTVLRNRSPKGFSPVTGNLLQNEAKNRDCRLPWDTYAADQFAISMG
jgi:hypothetical protein